MKVNRSPSIAMLWSVCIPGFGQLYNRDYVIGVLLFIIEIVVNVNSKLNLAIVYSFTAQTLLAAQVVDYQWLLFYPCVYAYSLWQAYNKAVEINWLNKGAGPDGPPLHFNGAFIGSAFCGTLGVIYSPVIGPVFGGILGMSVGAAAGFFTEKLFK